MILSLVLHDFVNLNVSQVHHLLATKLGYFVFLVSLVSLWPEFDDKYLGCTQRPQSRIWPKKAWYICYLNFVRATCIVLSPLHELELWLREKVQNLYTYVTCYEAWRLNVGGHHQIISKFETSSFICVVSSFVWLIILWFCLQTVSYRSLLISTYPFGWNEATTSRSMSLPVDSSGASQGKFDENKHY